MMGVTTYIKTVLCHNTEFTRRVRGRGKIMSSAHGLRLGREVDRAFTARVRGKPVGVQQKRVAAVFKALRAAGITVTASQSAATAHGVRTLVDAVGTIKGSPIALELKCTTASASTHKALYHTPCSACPVILSGKSTEPNTEYVRHQLQVGFAACALGIGKGVVVVSCTDSVLLYHLNPSFKEHHWFSHSSSGAVTPKSACKKEQCPAIVWPAATAVTPSPIVRICGRLAVLACGTAVAVRVQPSTLRRTHKRALAALFSGQKQPYYVIYPLRGGWQVASVKWLGV